jgi:hypothetical protein
LLGALGLMVRRLASERPDLRLAASTDPRQAAEQPGSRPNARPRLAAQRASNWLSRARAGCGRTRARVGGRIRAPRWSDPRLEAEPGVWR